jgi:hypothetical protein
LYFFFVSKNKIFTENDLVHLEGVIDREPIVRKKKLDEESFLRCEGHGPRLHAIVEKNFALFGSLGEPSLQNILDFEPVRIS